MAFYYNTYVQDLIIKDAQRRRHNQTDSVNYTRLAQDDLSPEPGL